MPTYIQNQINKTLLPQEHITYQTARSWVYLLPSVIVFLVLNGLSMVLWTLSRREIVLLGHPIEPHVLHWAALGIIGVGIILFLHAVARFASKLIVITPRRLLLTGQYGFSVNEIPLHALRDIQMKRSFLGMIFGYGTVFIIAGDGKTIPFTYIPQVHAFLQSLSQVAFPEMGH